MIPPPPISTLFPYTTLFRSFACPKELQRNLPTTPFLSLHPRSRTPACRYPEIGDAFSAQDRKSTRLNSSHGYISYAVFCLKKKKKKKNKIYTNINHYNYLSC